MSTLKDRYPGLRAFERDDQELFFGRDTAVNDVTKLIKSEKVTILYGNSGTGKSSLLNTKVTCQLEEENYFPIRVRFTGGLDKSDTTTTVQIIQKELELVIEQNKESKEIIFDSEKPGLWEYVKIIERSFQRNKTYDCGIVLIFDQFEEFFYFPDDQQFEFNEQIAELVHDWPPKRILDWVNGLNETDITNEILEWHKQPEVRVIFSIRSDKLSLLDSMVKVLPKVLRSRYELKTFNKENAIPAIIEPGLISNDEVKYNSPPIIFKSVKDQIINELKNELGEIEVSFLQVICSYLESFVVNKRKNDKKTSYEITKEDLNELKFDVSTILDKHYQDQTDKFPESDKKLIRKVIEDDLVISGQRASLLRAQLMSKLEKKAHLISDLLKARLIREETTARGLTYELCHDRLVPTVEKFKAIREELEKTEELEKQDLIRKENLEKQRVQLNKEKKLRQLAVDRRKEAEKEREHARQLAVEAKRNEQTAKELEKKATEAAKEADRQRKRARWLSYFVLTLGLGFFIGVIIFINKNKESLRSLDASKAKYFRERGTTAYKNLNVYEGFNFLYAADSLNKFDTNDTLLKSNHSTVFRATECVFSDDGYIQAVLLKDKLQVWKINQKPLALLKEFPDVNSFSLSGNGKTLIVLFKNENTEVWDISTIRWVGTFRNNNNNRDIFFSNRDFPYSLSWNGSKIGCLDSANNIIIGSVMEGTLKFDTITGLKTTESQERYYRFNQIRLTRDGKKILISDFSKPTTIKQENISYTLPTYYRLSLEVKMPKQISQAQRLSTLEKAKILFVPNVDTVFFLKEGTIKGFDLNSGSETKINIKVNNTISSIFNININYTPNSGHIMIKNNSSPIAYFYNLKDTSKNFILKDLKGDYFTSPKFEIYKDFIAYLDTANSLKVYFFKNNQYARLDKGNSAKDSKKPTKAFTYSESEHTLFYVEKETLFKAVQKGMDFNFQIIPDKYPVSGISTKNHFLLLTIDSEDEAEYTQVNSLKDTTIQQIRSLLPHLKLE